MATYTKTTNFTAKDNLTSGDPAKVIKGSEFDTEFNAIETAVNSKANANNGTHTGTTTISTANIDTLQIDGVTVTSTSAELNKLDGFTGDVTDLNKLAGVTATSTELNLLDGVTATTAELNILDGVTSTTAEINKLDGFTGTVDDLNYAKDLRATGVTTAEFDKLDGLTATTTELNILDGATVTTSELNILDGVTATASEINITDGLTATTAELNTLDGITATTAELNILDGVTATASEINTLDGITATTTELNYTDGVTSNIQTQLDAMVEKAGDTMTGDLSLGDNVKAKFGASDDLQIYHDGSHSWIKDTGTGDLTIQGDNLYLEKGDGTKFLYGVSSTGQVRLYHGDAQKFITTSTGVDVTGTVTADGLTVEGTTGLNWAAGASSSGLITIGDGGNSGGSAWFNTPSLSSVYNSGFGISGNYGSNLSTIELGAYGVKHPSYSSEMSFLTQDVGTSAVRERLKIHNNGDVHLYEDTGTTAKFVWDSSAENLNITGQKDSTSLTLSAPLVTVGGGNLADYNEIYFDNTSGNGDAYIRHYSNAHNDSHSALTFGTTTTGTIVEAMRIDGAGNVGIGVAAVNNKLHIATDTNGTGLTLQRNSTTSGDFAELSFNMSDNSVGDPNLWMRGYRGSSFSANYLTFGTNNTERLRIDSSGNVGIGTSSPSNTLDVAGIIRSTSTNPQLRIHTSSGTGTGFLVFGDSADDDIGQINYAHSDNSMRFVVNTSERARIDSSGNLLVGKTATGSGVDGFSYVASASATQLSRTSGDALSVNRNSTDGAITVFRKNGSTVGSIGAYDGRPYLASTTLGIRVSNALFPCDTSGVITDGACNIGGTSGRFKDLYLSGGVYLGGTGSANKLDDYEEGLSTLTVTPSGSGTISLYSTENTISYTKVGRLVTVTGRLIVQSVSSPVGGSLIFSGLPFTIADLAEGSSYTGGVISYRKYSPTGWTVEPFFSQENETKFYIVKDASTIANDDRIHFTFSYVTA